MPAISGSDLAPTQFRFNIGRFGATRFGYYHPLLRVIVNGSNEAARVKLETLEILDRLHEEPNVCSFTLREGTAPVVGQAIVVSLGNATDHSRLFAGHIVDVRQIQVMAAQEVTFQVMALDYTRFLDRRLVTTEYRSQTADAIARHLIQTYTTGGFTTNHIQAGLTNVSVFVLTNVRLATALTRLANLIGGAWYVDEYQDVHFFLTEPTLPNPPDLTVSNTKFWDLETTVDLSQVRTRILVEGQRTTVPILAVPAGATSFPVNDDLIFNPAETPASGGGITYTRSARIGTQPFFYTAISEINLIPGVSYPGTNVTTDAAIGATTLEIDALPPDAPAWALVGNQVIFALDFDTGPNRLIQIPASGYGSIQAAIESGTEVSWLPYLVNIPDTGDMSIRISQPEGTEVVMRLQVDNTTAQAALAAVEGGDGIHEHLVQDGRLSVTGAQARALAELDDFGASVQSIRYRTRDTRTRTGRTVTVSLPAPTSLSGAFLIRTVTIDGFDELASRTSHHTSAFPKRTIEAMPIRLGGMVDQLVTGEDST